ncbi:MAG: FtsX-like permease family protein [Proteobacteria bacterium]|nr:FtsX-like permease family protein [Pseudomonadota bacterium]
MAWVLARRELSWRFRGLRLLVVCLALGVGALAAIGSLTAAISGEIGARGRTILGGDVEAIVWQRMLNPEERALLARHGAVSAGTRMQAIAANGAVSVPVELKAVDAGWPLVGRLKLADGRLVGAPPAGTAWLAPGAAARLGLAPGARFTVAGTALTVGGIVADEPDRLAEGFALGPTVIVPLAMPEAAGLTAPGAMFRSRTRLACAQACDAAALAAELKASFPSAGLELRTRDKAAPGAENFLTRMGDFLQLVGLSALLIAGLGIGGGTASYLEARAGGIATLKVLGASSRDVARVYLIQIAMAALAGSVIGLAAGTLALPLLGRALAGVLPLHAALAPAPGAMLRASAYGLLTALAFAAPPLAAARAVPAMALLRARIAPPRPPRSGLALGALALAGVAALAIATSPAPAIAAMFLGGAAGTVLLLGGVGWAIRRGAARLPRPSGAMLRLGLANLHRPAAQTGRLVTALGFGLAAFVLLATVQTSLDANVAARVPAKAPDYFVLDLDPARLEEFTRLVATRVPQARLRAVPAMRGAILAYGPADRMTRVADLAEIPDDAWALKGERGLTYAEALPEGNAITAGAWWPAHYLGEPLVSVDEKFARAVDLKVGDRITIGLLGTERSARVASLRRIDWDSFGFNNVLVFSPNAIADAPHKLAATIMLPPAAKDAGAKAGLLAALGRAFPSSSVIEVGPLLGDARALLGQVSQAILAAASVAVLAGIAVLTGAIAAARAARAYDQVVLRVLGASRGQLVAAAFAEYALLAGVLATVALGLGSALGWLVVVKLFKFAFLPDWGRVLTVLGAGLALVLGWAMAAVLPLLRTRPAAVLREL